MLISRLESLDCMTTLMDPVDMITAVLKTKFVSASNTFEVEVFVPLNG